MLKDLKGDDWLDILNFPTDRISLALVLRGTRKLKTDYQEYLQHLTNVLEIGTPNKILEEVQTWFRAGYYTVNMETATTFAIAQYLGMDLAFILCVFANPRQKKHIFMSKFNSQVLTIEFSHG